MPNPDSDFRCRSELNTRRFSSGERQSEIVGRPVWKFDVSISIGPHRREQGTCYIREVDRGLAFQALFDRFPGARAYGTGLPITDEQALAETRRPLNDGEMLLIR